MPSTQTNVEYWFRLFYECLHGSCYGSIGFSQFSAMLAHIWLWIIVVGYILSVLALVAIIYLLIRLFELRKREEEHYRTLVYPQGAAATTDKRWDHIESLAESASASDWRTAIIEADIMLDDILMKNGYVGESLGERLKSVDPKELHSLSDAWEAHKVRNQIAHEGSAFILSDTLARRTISRYESVFREFKAI